MSANSAPQRVRGQVRAALVGLLLAGPGSAALGVAAPAAVTSLDSVGFTVADLSRSRAFFTEVLDFEPVADVEVSGDAVAHLQGVFGLRARVQRLRLGQETLELTQYLAPVGRTIPEGLRSQDHAFQHVAIVVADMAKAYARLRAHGVRQVSASPQRLPEWNPNAGGIEAFYFKDPDGHVLELIQFPAGKGDPRWQQPQGRLFLGLDHTAIGVADSTRSLVFYRDLLGLTVTGTSENWGPEQEHLNAVFGARLRITGLRAPAGGPGVELLEYLAPSDGLPAPRDMQANDLLHWQTTLRLAQPEASERALFAARARFVSPGLVNLPDALLGFTRGLMLRDPDGHALRLVAP